MQQGGGIGYDFTTLRPKDSPVKGVDADASGPLTFMNVWDAMCRTVMSAGSRRGAMMATMRCDHPDIEDFITAKSDTNRLRMFNVSVLATDEFMSCVENDADWPLMHEVPPAEPVTWNNVTQINGKHIYKVIRAKDLWETMMKSTYDYAEPGVIFIDQINQANNLNYCETISATNPCFAGDEKIVTADGPKTFLELEGKRVSVLTENQAGKLVYHPMDVFKTATDQELLLVTLNDGTKIKCTHTHEFFDLDRNRIEARDLVSGQRLASVYRHNANSKGYDRPNHKVISIEPLVERQDVFCGTVEETHKFFLACDRGSVLVSNCGEQPLPPYGACLLGSVNLVKMVDGPFEKSPMVNQSRLEETVRAAVRLLDKVIDISNFPIPEQKAEALYKRRMGLGITGLADMLFMMNLNYNSQDGINLAERVMKIIAITAYEESIELAKEFGPCPATETKEQREAFCKSGFMKQMPEHIHLGVMEHGIRNALLTSIAPTGTISLYAGNVSSGIEPVFAPSYTRKVLEKDGSKREELVEDYAVKLYHEWRENIGMDKEPNPPHLVTAQTLDPLDHILMQSAVQKWVDSSISKTINVPEDISFEDFERVYTDAYAMGCKGCTTYRPNEVTGSILSIEKDEPEKTDQAPERVGFIRNKVNGEYKYIPVREDNDPTPRPDTLDGSTYKIKYGPDAVYITITDIEENGVTRPFEIFINSKNIEHYAWTIGMARMISAVFRRSHNSHFVVQELKEVFDPKGGAWMKQKYVPSLLAAIGGVIEEHMIRINYVGGYPAILPEADEETPVIGMKAVPSACPQCKGFNVHLSGGCPVCADCGHSKCG